MQTTEGVLAAARAGDEAAFADLITPYRRELRAHCYRMAGSLHDADDLYQESLLRAWRGLTSFEGRSSLRTWLYKVTTSACLDAVERRSARALPADVGSRVRAGDPFGPPRMDPVWLEPCPEELYRDAPVSPEARYTSRESVAFAFLVALQLLPPKQRAVLILRDVLGWQAAECGELLGLTVAAANSALQRARETLATRADTARQNVQLDDDATSALLARYVQAWEQADVSLLVSLLHEDATLAMPPLSEWLQGPADIGAAIRAMVLTPDAAGLFRLVRTEANGLPALATYARSPETGELQARSIHVIEIRDGRIAAMMAFLNPSLFGPFGLPVMLAQE